MSKQRGSGMAKERYYTDNTKVNEMLNAYARQAQDGNVALSVDMMALQGDIPENLFYDVLAMAMEQAFNNCVNTTFKRNGRYVKIRTMACQKQIFIKIQNSSDENIYDEKNLESIQKLLNTDKGYFKYSTKEDEKEMLIAMHI